ncbi:SDR family NAD(P)-dependent oxidoreductase [Microbulbifer sp. S227A]|uniref:SDR family NAD(P)-dependent oxidoreductase n=1 Tax=Microbulbifer sp. S227A TaxID=3415131 RepID=UPI003C7ED187
MNRLDNKIALITGGANGQGAAEAELFIDAGAKVVITDVNSEAGEATAARLGENCAFLQHDVSSQDDWARVVDAVVDLHGRIDVLVNNAGIFRVLGLADTDLGTWEQTVAINQTGVFLGMKAVAPVMQANRAGSIINISSIAGLAASKAHAYCATKWAVRGMTKAAAVELGPSNIRVNSIHPGYIETPMLDAFGVPRQELVAKIPFGRTAEVIEVAKVVLFVASDDAGYCTGHEFVVDGAIKA